MLLIALALLPAAAEGATWKVIAKGGGDRPTIQAAIDAASQGDTILVGPGTYTGPGNRDIELRGKAVALIGSGPARTILDSQGQPGEPHRGFFVHEGEGAKTRIDGFTITGGYVEGALPANYGGGILLEGSSPTITNCWIVKNRSSHFGGGMVCYQKASPKLMGLRFFDNEAVNNGGGLGVKSFCTVDLTDVLFVRNTAKRGGGMWCLTSTLTLDGATFYGNAGLESTGGIWSSQASLTIRSTIIAFSRTGEALSCSSPPQVIMVCSDVFGNEGGDEVAGCLNAGGANFSADPQFSNPDGDDYSLAPTSPCLPGKHPTGGDCPQTGYGAGAN
jgi:hypothetical protein